MKVRIRLTTFEKEDNMDVKIVVLQWAVTFAIFVMAVMLIIQNNFTAKVMAPVAPGFLGIIEMIVYITLHSEGATFHSEGGELLQVIWVQGIAMSAISIIFMMVLAVMLIINARKKPRKLPRHNPLDDRFYGAGG